MSVWDATPKNTGLAPAMVWKTVSGLVQVANYQFSSAVLMQSMMKHQAGNSQRGVFTVPLKSLQIPTTDI